MRWRCWGLLSALLITMLSPVFAAERKIGVLFVVHGGSGKQAIAHTFDSTLQFFQYDPNNVIYQRIIWNPAAWPMVVSAGDSQAYANAATLMKKFSWLYARVGGTDPAPMLADVHLRDMGAALEKLGQERAIEFTTDIAQWIGLQDQADRLPWPRYMYYPKVEGGAVLDYCGSEKDGGPWGGCDPQRYNTDGPAERVLKKGAEEILMIDLTVGGIRFWKTYDVVKRTRLLVADWNERHGTDVRVSWVNDPTDLMADSYPVDPPNWTRALGPPKVDSRVPLAGRGNPVIEDPLMTEMVVDGIVASFNPDVAPAETAVLFINHATRDGNETYDPKIDDTLVVDALVKKELLRRYPQIRADNIIGGWMGIRQENPNIETGGRVRSQLERTREMRGEDLGGAWLYESEKQLPGGDHGYRYWDALDLLREREVAHIVVVFTQIVIDSVLNMVEVPNQIAKEIGRETWLYADQLDFDRYPEIGHPFADVWGVWVDQQCRIGDSEETGPCCFELGGCSDGRPYPPPRQAPLHEKREDTDPSLGFDVPAYGHLGYDPEQGPPSETRPVQGQYRGTWAMWQAANKDPRMGILLARQVQQFLDQRGAAR